jgi:hypothetical protein
MTGVPRRPLLVAALVAVICTLWTTPAAADGGLSVDITTLDAEKPGDVVAVVNVTDASGRPVPALTGENFDARAGGSPVSVGR